MNFSKLLCLVLVYSQQFGQVLTAVQTSEDCQGTAGSTVTCKRKKGDTVKLKIAASSNTKWMKGTITITNEVDKREISVDVKTLTIKTLAEGDEGEYTASTSPEEKFQVQVVPVCEGSQIQKPTCKGKLGGELELKISINASGDVSWKKGKTPIPKTTEKYTLGTTNNVPLTIKDLKADDEGEYTASGGGLTKPEVFTVQVATICTGSSSSPKACVGTLNKDLVLKVGSPATQKVDWKKDGSPVSGDKYVKSGTDDIALRITNLAAGDAGTYTAAYDKNTADTKETFTVSFPSEFDVAQSTRWYETRKALTRKHFAFHWQWKLTKKLAHSAALFPLQSALAVLRAKVCGKFKRCQLTFSNCHSPIHIRKPRDENGHGGSVLSYSPALLVTVTLVHLLLQLAA
nr:uncharacterized protein LOC125968822 [Syngnathus scovelli]